VPGMRGSNLARGAEVPVLSIGRYAASRSVTQVSPMHSHLLATFSHWLDWLSVTIAVGALVAGTQLEWSESAKKAKAPSTKYALPDPASMTQRGRRYYRLTGVLFALALTCYVLARVAAGIYSLNSREVR
jgi:hypothetical protein